MFENFDIKTIIRQPAYIIVAVMIAVIAILKITAPETVSVAIISMGTLLFGFTLLLAKKESARQPIKSNSIKD